MAHTSASGKGPRNILRSDHPQGDNKKCLDISSNFLNINFCNVHRLISNFQSVKLWHVCFRVSRYRFHNHIFGLSLIIVKKKNKEEWHGRKIRQCTLWPCGLTATVNVYLYLHLQISVIREGSFSQIFVNAGAQVYRLWGFSCSFTV